MGSAEVAAVTPPDCASVAYGALAGVDGWLFAEDAWRALSGLGGSEGDVVSQWSESLASNAHWLAEQGIRYCHIGIPDKLSLYGELLAQVDGASIDAERHSPMRQLSTRHKGQLPCLLDPTAYLSRQKDNYPLFWKSDTRWTPWACYMTYQLLCGRLGVEVNNVLLGYPFSEAPHPMNLDTGAGCVDAQAIRTYRLQLRSRRRHANALSVQRETVFASHDPALSLARYGQGAQTVFENHHAQTSPLTVMIFGEANAGDGRTLLTGMLAESFAEVHFVWSPVIDHAYIEQVRPDVVITQATELQMSRAPANWLDFRTASSVSLLQLNDDLAAGRVTLRAPACVLKGADRGAEPMHTRRLLLARETYELAPPVLLQPHGDFADRETCMSTNEVTLSDVHQASVYFTGPAWLVHDGAGQEVLRHEVPATQQSRSRWTRARKLPGLSLMFATSAGAHCYYHWMTEILPKLGLLEREGIALDTIDYILVRKISGDWQRQTLARFGIDSTRIVETEKQPHLQCERLLHIDLNCGINLKMHRFIPQWMQHLYPLQATNEPRLKLYITRPAGVRRGISNERDFIPMLKEAGFTVLAMEGLSVAEQAALLARTDVLMSPHGGALTNMVFSRPGITVIELFSRHVFPYYYGLAANCAHQYHAILENPVEDYPRLVNSRIAQSHADRQHETAGLSFAAPVDAIAELLKSL